MGISLFCKYFSSPATLSSRSSTHSSRLLHPRSIQLGHHAPGYTYLPIWTPEGSEMLEIVHFSDIQGLAVLTTAMHIGMDLLNTRGLACFHLIGGKVLASRSAYSVQLHDYTICQVLLPRTQSPKRVNIMMMLLFPPKNTMVWHQSGNATSGFTSHYDRHCYDTYHQVVCYQRSGHIAPSHCCFTPQAPSLRQWPSTSKKSCALSKLHLPLKFTAVLLNESCRSRNTVAL